MYSLFVIYDTTGHIINTLGGSDVYVPVGVPSMWVEIPNGKYLKSIDVSDPNNHKPILIDITTFDLETATLDEVKEYYINKSNQLLSEYYKENPISSSVHGGVEKLYSITKDKRDYLVQMIMMAQMSLQNNIDYQPSWNATGEECTYDWTLQELQQLAFEIESIVRPLVNKQQRLENDIKACTTKDEVVTLSISY